MADRYSIAFAPAGLAYVRQVLGTRPYDEVAVLIQNLDQQVREQDHPPAPTPPPGAEAPLEEGAPALKVV